MTTMLNNMIGTMNRSAELLRAESSNLLRESAWIRKYVIGDDRNIDNEDISLMLDLQQKGINLAHYEMAVSMTYHLIQSAEAEGYIDDYNAILALSKSKRYQSKKTRHKKIDHAFPLRGVFDCKTNMCEVFHNVAHMFKTSDQDTTLNYLDMHPDQITELDACGYLLQICHNVVPAEQMKFLKQQAAFETAKNSLKILQDKKDIPERRISFAAGSDVIKWYYMDHNFNENASLIVNTNDKYDVSSATWIRSIKPRAHMMPYNASVN